MPRLARQGPQSPAHRTGQGSRRTDGRSDRPPRRGPPDRQRDRPPRCPRNAGSPCPPYRAAGPAIGGHRGTRGTALTERSCLAGTRPCATKIRSEDHCPSRPSRRRPVLSASCPPPDGDRGSGAAKRGAARRPESVAGRNEAATPCARRRSFCFFPRGHGGPGNRGSHPGARNASGPDAGPERAGRHDCRWMRPTRASRITGKSPTSTIASAAWAASS